MPVLSLLLCYLIGSIPTSVIISKLARGVDVRDLGTGNAGASNVLIQIGPLFGVLTGAFDILKGVLCVFIPLWVGGTSSVTFAYLGGAIGVLGHIFPLYLGFRGGKGLATLVGMILALDFFTALLFIVFFLVLTYASGYIALGCVALCSAYTLYTALFLQLPLETGAMLVLLLVMLVKHKENFKRIKTGCEDNVRDVLFKKKKHEK